MADLEDVTLDGRPLHSLRVADLKAALEERGLSKSGQKNALIKRLKGVSLITCLWLKIDSLLLLHRGLSDRPNVGGLMAGKAR